MNGTTTKLVALALSCLMGANAEEVIAPRASATLVSGPPWTVSSGTFSNAHDRDSYATVIFDVPASSTNLEGFVRFSRASPLIGRHEVFAFDAPDKITTNIISLPVYFAGALETNGAVTYEIDVSPWVRLYAGRRLGIQVRRSPELRSVGRTGFESFSLRIDSPDARDAASHFTWQNSPPRLLDTNMVTVATEIFDVDGQITEWRLLDNARVVIAENFAPGLAPGTNRLSCAVSNLTHGLHSFVFQAVSGTNIASSEAKLTFVLNPDDWPHRWLGSQGNSGSFYVVDAAGRAHVWGRNDAGQLGLGFRSSEYIRQPVTLLPPDGLRFRQMASASNSTIALTDDGNAYAWGKIFGTVYVMPRRVGFGSADFMYRRIAANDLSIFTLNQDGYLYSDYFPPDGRRWVDVKAGAENYLLEDISGRLGDVNIPSEAVPVKDFASGSPFSYAVGADDQLYSWQVTAPGLVNEIHFTGVTGWQLVVTSRALTLAIDDRGRVWKWGAGFSTNEFNPGAPKLVQFPKQITNWLDIAVTSSLAIALADTGELFAWGLGVPGMWADPTVANAVAPEIVRGLPDLLDPNVTSTAAAFLSTTTSGTTLNLRIAAASGSEILVQSSSDLKNWLTISNVTSQSGTAVVKTPLDPLESKFFRIAP